jgi:hypothetical protein
MGLMHPIDSPAVPVAGWCDAGRWLVVGVTPFAYVPVLVRTRRSSA